LKILALETSGDACSAALWIDGGCQEKFELTPRAHSKLILPMVDELMSAAGLKPQQLDAIAFGRGPGSFTGVRIAAGVAQGIAFGADLPVLPVSALAALAQDFFNNHSEWRTAFTALDARMNEIYWATYQQNSQGLAELIGDETVTDASQIRFPDAPGFGVGSGWAAHGEVLRRVLGHRVADSQAIIYPRAAVVAPLGASYFQQGLAAPADQALPVYLRDKVAKTLLERESGA